MIRVEGIAPLSKNPCPRNHIPFNPCYPQCRAFVVLSAHASLSLPCFVSIALVRHRVVRRSGFRRCCVVLALSVCQSANGWKGKPCPIRLDLTNHTLCDVAGSYAGMSYKFCRRQARVLLICIWKGARYESSSKVWQIFVRCDDRRV